MKFLTAISLIMVVAACSFATVQQADTRPWTEIPTVTRADTHDFIRDGMRYEREIDIIYMWTVSQISLPNEVAFCLYGHAIDTTVTYTSIDTGEPVDVPKKVAIIDSVGLANIQNATPTYVQFTDGIACDPSPRLIGTAHTHPNVPHPAFNAGRCTHSDNDVLYAQHRETEYWFTLVLCTWTHELMWADGRRVEYYVRNPTDPMATDQLDEPDEPTN